MNFVSPTQEYWLTQMQERRVPLMEVPANTAASMMHKGYIVYHSEKNGVLKYRITPFGKQAQAAQEWMSQAKPYRQFMKDITVEKRRGRRRRPTLRAVA